MCNYLNNYDNLNWCSLHSVYFFMKNVQKMYSLFEYSGLLRFFYPSTTLKNHKGGISNVKFSYNTFQNSFVLVSGPYLP